MSVQVLRRESSPSVTEDTLRDALSRQREAFLAHGPPSYNERRLDLRRLLKMILDNEDRLLAAIDADFGGRSAEESRRLELLPSLMGLRHTIRHLRRWMRPVRRRAHWATWPSRARIELQPLGVVGVIAPWNYPFFLAIGPLTGALAAGNRVMIKPSEYTPKTSSLLAELIAQTFPPEKVMVFNGGPEVAKSFSSLPFDHLLFTGSTGVGRLVMRAASENLVPVTLELGGKSPLVLAKDYPLRPSSLGQVLSGKLLNAGQTCVAPDYLLVHESQRDALVAALGEALAEIYPKLADNTDYTAIINERHRERLLAHLRDAEEKGATLIELNPGGESSAAFAAASKLPLTLAVDVDDSMTVMQDEIFGPILPIETYSDLDQAVARINARPRPLAAYLFSHDRGIVRDFSERVVSGALSINATLIHVAQDDIPFGGVGPSGMGHYHAREGFLTFSHQKAVYHQLQPNLMHLILPPYTGELKKKLIRVLLEHG
ncbi:coniferyl aldehyde dehydrogenase [Pseudenhygromyxa sp. WMMC2535]|uniref:coniferyl aldehyde dehydrogenase n=1 Tax=Pseudenhygromyxa sp. WMMC2535 TaxID=2712867 RepID=UPI001555C333|nr:coniferyl aldehyde dehydrogenase [Pseudenhygromyxa sp. WMMC2535]NVB40903.1 coniferyl aldehyde dehydrogenase [Pseudenhygromyxa sp. WMMC2535]